MPIQARNRSRHIVAMGGGGFSMEPDNPHLDEYVLRLTGKRRPKICFLPTASGDAASYIDRFYAAMETHSCRPGHLCLFKHNQKNVADFVMDQDVIYVGGGNTANMLAVWRLQGVDKALRAAWRKGTVLCGLSAGANCWFEASSTDSFGNGLAPLHDGLGLIKGSCCPHYDGEPQRRPTYRRMIQSGRLPAGYAFDDGAAGHFIGRKLAEVVASRPKARAYEVRRIGRRVVELEILPRML